MEFCGTPNLYNQKWKTVVLFLPVQYKKMVACNFFRKAYQLSSTLIFITTSVELFSKAASISSKLLGRAITENC